MLIHNVYFWLKEGIAEADQKAFEKGMRDLADGVDEVQKIEIGISASTPPRDVVDHSFGFSMFLWFENVDHHNIYQNHPAHHQFVHDFAHLWSEVQVRDSQIK